MELRRTASGRKGHATLMTVAIDFDVMGEKQVSRELLRFGSRALDARPAWALIMDDMMDAAARQFDTEGQSGSGGWAPLAESTILEKNRLGFDLNPLIRTLELRDSLTEPAHPMGIRFMSKDSLQFGSRVPYGPFHQRGTVNMPQRRPVDFTELERKQFLKQLQEYIVKGKVATGALT